MAVFTLSKELPFGSQVVDWFSVGFFAIVDGAANPKSLTIKDNIGNKIIYTGTSFTYDLNGPTGGTVTKIKFVDYMGDEVMTVTEAKVKLADIEINDTEGNFKLFEAGNKTFNGSKGDDWIVFENGAGNDTVNGLGGADYIEASAGRNAYDGGKGNDTLTYQNIFIHDEDGVVGMSVNLQTGNIVNPFGKTDTVTNIEEVTGTAGIDVFIGSDRAERINAFAGDDTVTGGKGADTFVFMYNAGADIYKDFGKGADKFYLTNTTTSFEEVMEKASQVGKNVEIDFGGGDKIIIQNFKLDDLTADHFDYHL